MIQRLIKKIKKKIFLARFLNYAKNHIFNLIEIWSKIGYFIFFISNY